MPVRVVRVCYCCGALAWYTITLHSTTTNEADDCKEKEKKTRSSITTGLLSTWNRIEIATLLLFRLGLSFRFHFYVNSRGNTQSEKRSVTPILSHPPPSLRWQYGIVSIVAFITPLSKSEKEAPSRSSLLAFGACFIALLILMMMSVHFKWQ